MARCKFLFQRVLQNTGPTGEGMLSSTGGLAGDWEDGGEVGEMGNGGRDEGAGRGEAVMNGEGNGNEGGRVG